MAETQDTPDVPEVEAQALEHGWMPEEDFKADPKNSGKKWRPAEEFMDRKSLFDKIEDQHKQIRDLKKGVDALTLHNKSIEQSTYERARKELAEERKAALKDGDFAKAEELRDRIDEIKVAASTAQATPQTQQEAPEFVQFKQQNDWYQGNTRDAVKMTAWAEGYGFILARQGKSPADILVEVHKAAREEFPEHFNKRNPNKNDAGAAPTGRQSRAVADSFRLTPEEDQVMKRMIRAGVKITEAEYKEQLKKAKGY